MAHILSPPHPFLTTRPITLENTNSRIVHDSFFRINGYSSSIESNDEDKPLDFSKKKTESSTSHLKREVFEAPNALLEHLQDIKPRNVHQANIVESPRSPPRCISPALSNNPQLYTSPPPTILMEQLAYVKALSKCNPLFPNLNLHVPLAERPDPSNKHQELLCKMMEDQNFDGSMTNTREFSRNSSPPADPSSNHLKFNNSFTPIVLTPPPSTVADSHIRQEQMTKSSTFQPAEEVSILQRTLTAPQLDDSTNVQRNAKNAKQPRPFKTYNPLPRSFPASLPVMPLGAIQDLEDQEYRYQQYMDSYYTNKNSKIRSDTRSRESIDQQAGSSGDDRRESPSASDSPPRPPTSNQIKTFEDSNGSSVDVQVSRRQAADTSTSPNDSRSNKRIRSLPEELKDAAYWERRRKNNEAAKRSRDTRRQKEDFIAMRARFLEDENKNLRLTVAFLRQELSTIKCCAAHNHNRF